jgi:hypothetical protein
LPGVAGESHAGGVKAQVQDEQAHGRQHREKVSGTDWTNQGEFTFSFWASLYAGGAACPLDSRATLLAATNAIHHHLRLFGLLMHVGSPGKKSKTEAINCPARTTPYEDGGTSDLVLDCGGTVSFTKSFVYLGSLLHCDLSDDHDVDARIKKASKAFGAAADEEVRNDLLEHLLPVLSHLRLATYLIEEAFGRLRLALHAPLVWHRCPCQPVRQQVELTKELWLRAVPPSALLSFFMLLPNGSTVGVGPLVVG